MSITHRVVRDFIFQNDFGAGDASNRFLLKFLVRPPPSSPSPACYLSSSLSRGSSPSTFCRRRYLAEGSAFLDPGFSRRRRPNSARSAAGWASSARIRRRRRRLGLCSVASRLLPASRLCFIVAWARIWRRRRRPESSAPSWGCLGPLPRPSSPLLRLALLCFDRPQLLCRRLALLCLGRL